MVRWRLLLIIVFYGGNQYVGSGTQNRTETKTKYLGGSCGRKPPPDAPRNEELPSGCTIMQELALRKGAAGARAQKVVFFHMKPFMISFGQAAARTGAFSFPSSSASSNHCEFLQLEAHISCHHQPASFNSAAC